MIRSITEAEYEALQMAYDFFNAELFNGSLPNVLVTLQRKARTRGYFAPERFTVHEMTHVWQQVYGESTRGYHESAVG